MSAVRKYRRPRPDCCIPHATWFQLCSLEQNMGFTHLHSDCPRYRHSLLRKLAAQAVAEASDPGLLGLSPSVSSASQSSD